MSISSDLRLISAMARRLASNLDNVPVEGMIPLDSALQFCDLLAKVKRLDNRLSAHDIDGESIDVTLELISLKDGYQDSSPLNTGNGFFDSGVDRAYLQVSPAVRLGRRRSRSSDDGDFATTF